MQLISDARLTIRGTVENIVIKRPDGRDPQGKIEACLQFKGKERRVHAVVRDADWENVASICGKALQKEEVSVEGDLFPDQILSRLGRIVEIHNTNIKEPDDVSARAPNPLLVAVATLPPKQRAVILLCYALNQNSGEIADALDVTPAGVRILLSEAYGNLIRIAGR
jgi:DNA-directed RNA polymerase specialized sigma24 family protein